MNRSGIKILTSYVLSLIIVITSMLPSMPLQVYASETSSNKRSGTVPKVTVSKYSGDFLSGYYVVYKFNDHYIRSDQTTVENNLRLLDKLDPAEKDEVLLNFTAVPGKFKEQFGVGRYDELMEWHDTYKGWKEGREILKDRIANREFPRAAYFLQESLEVRSDVDLPDIPDKLKEKGLTDDNEIRKYTKIPEVKEYYDLVDSMGNLYGIVSYSYQRLRDSKAEQVSIAVRSLSHDLIGLIVDRAMVPAISPGGLSALAPNLQGEIYSAIDKLGDVSGFIHGMVGVKTIDAASARKAIDKYWEYINYCEEMANDSIDAFLVLKSQKRAKYQAAMDALVEYFDKKDGEAKKRTDEAQAQITEPVTHESEAGKTREEMWDELAELNYQFNDWLWDLGAETSEWASGKDMTMHAELQEIGSNAVNFDDWEVINGWRVDLYSIEPGPSLVYNTWLNGGFPVFTQLSPVADDSYDKAIKHASDYLAKLDAYTVKYNRKVESIDTDIDEFKSKYYGLLDGLGLTPEDAKNSAGYLYDGIYLGNAKEKIANFRVVCGNASVRYQTMSTINNVTLDLNEFKGVIETYKKELEEKKAEWDEFEPQMYSKMSADYDEIRALENEYTALLDSVESCGDDKKSGITNAEDIVGDGYTFNETHEAKIKELYDSNQGAALEEYLEGLADRVAPLQNDISDDTHTIDNALERSDLISQEIISVCSPYGAVRYIELLNETFNGDLMPLSKLTQRRSDLVEYTRNMSDQNVRPAFQELTGANRMAINYDEEFAYVMENKPNYMRNPSSRSLIKAGIFDLHRYEKLHYTEYFRHSGLVYTETQKFNSGTGKYGDKKTDNLFSRDIPGGFDYDLEHGLYTPVDSVKLNDGASADIELDAGRSIDISDRVSVYPANASDTSIVWESSDTSVCRVTSQGVVTAVGDGVAEISARATDSAWEKTGETIEYKTPFVTFTVTAGSGLRLPDESSYNADSGCYWKNYGSEGSPELFKVVDSKSGERSINAGVFPASDKAQSLAFCLYDSNDQLVKAKVVDCYCGTDWYPVSMSLPYADGDFQFKVYSIADNNFTVNDNPVFESVIGGSTGDADIQTVNGSEYTFTCDDLKPDTKYAVYSVAGNYTDEADLHFNTDLTTSLRYINYVTTGSDDTSVSFDVKPVNSDSDQTVFISGITQEDALGIEDSHKIKIVGHIHSNIPDNGEKTRMPEIDTPQIKVLRSNAQVAFPSVSKGTRIYYTLDGSAPTVDSFCYDAPISIQDAIMNGALLSDGNVTIRAIAVSDGQVPSDVKTFVYSVSDAIEDPGPIPPTDPSVDNIAPASGDPLDPDNPVDPEKTDVSDGSTVAPGENSVPVISQATKNTLIVGDIRAIQIKGFAPSDLTLKTTKCATYENGLLKTVKKGTVKLIAMVPNEKGKLKKKVVCTVKITEPKLKSKLKMSAGKTKLLKLSSANGYQPDWSSSSGSVVDVVKDGNAGKLHAINSGEAMITAVIPSYPKDHVYNCTVTVK